MYQQIRLSDTSLVGAPGPLPYAVAGWTDDLLRDLSWLDPRFGLAGMAFWPVVVSTPSFDPTKQVAVPPASYAADPTTMTVTGAATVRDMTGDEYAAVHPPRTATAKQVRYALSDLGVRAAWETAAGPGKATQAMQDWWGWTDPIAEDATKLGRLCTAVGITPTALFDRAVSE